MLQQNAFTFDQQSVSQWWCHLASEKYYFAPVCYLWILTSKSMVVITYQQFKQLMLCHT